MALEISDFPPPETVQGLWHSVPSGDGPDQIARHLFAGIGFSMRTR